MSNKEGLDVIRCIDCVNRATPLMGHLLTLGDADDLIDRRHASPDFVPSIHAERLHPFIQCDPFDVPGACSLGGDLSDSIRREHEFVDADSAPIADVAAFATSGGLEDRNLVLEKILGDIRR